MRIYLCLFLTLALGGLSGCSSLQRDADHLLENKEYDAALRIYDRILQSQPSDVQALSGRTKARHGVIQQELLEARFLRLSGQQGRANETLMRSVARVKDWNLYPEGAVASTQQEEMNFASRSIEDDIDRSLVNGRPFQAQSLLQNWGALFPSNRVSALVDLRNRTQVSGTKTCQRWAKDGADQPFFTRFLNRACSIWVQLDLENPPAEELFGWLEPRFRWIEGVPQDPGSETQLKEELQASFRRSPFYESSAQSVAFALVEPHFSFEEKRTEVELTHAYLVSVPYPSTEPVNVQKWVSDDSLVTVSDGRGGTRSEVVRASKMVTETQIHTITRYRDEVRSIPYAATQIEVKSQLDFEIRPQSNVFDEIKKSYLVREDVVLVQHSNNSPEVRLTPENPIVPVASEVFHKLAVRGSVDYELELASLWRRKFCQAPKSGGWMRVAERVQKCLHGAGDDVPDFVTRWMDRELGVTWAELKALGGPGTVNTPSLQPSAPALNRGLSSSENPAK